MSTLRGSIVGVGACIATFCVPEAWAQDVPKLPMHGWVAAEVGTGARVPRGWVGLAAPVSRVTSVAVEASGSDESVGLAAGPTVEWGVLYVLPMLGFEVPWKGPIVFNGQFRAVLEILPAPLYFETWLINRMETEQDWTTRELETRTLGLVTFHRALAVGMEFDSHQTSARNVREEVGLRVNIGAGSHVVLGLFTGTDTDSLSLVGRAFASLTW